MEQRACASLGLPGHFFLPQWLIFSPHFLKILTSITRKGRKESPICTFKPEHRTKANQNLKFDLSIRSAAMKLNRHSCCHYFLAHFHLHTEHPMGVSPREREPRASPSVASSTGLDSGHYFACWFAFKVQFL